MARRDGGFTLVEMLVSLVVLGLLAVLIVQGVGTGTRVWRHSRDSVGAVERVEAAQTLLRDRIERLRPVTRFEGNTPVSDLGGDAQSFSFVSLPLDSERPARARHYTVLRNGDGDLVLRWSLDDGSPEPEETDEVLLKGVDDLEIAYLDSGADGAPAWRADWFHQAAPPRAVRLRVEFPEGDPRVWPEMIVRPAARVDTLCILEPATGLCRGRQ